MPVPLKQAVAKAVEFATGVLENRALDVQLEEVESVDTNGTGVWLITLSMIGQNPVGIANLNPFQRFYRTFTVRKDNGEVTAMKIREFAGQ